MAAKKKAPKNPDRSPPPAKAANNKAAKAKATEKASADAAERRQVGCLECGLCCTYIALEIDPPTTPNRATQVLWYLYHERVSVYWDNEDDWVVQFETRCRHLAADNKCGIYEMRPQICRDFDETGCEINAEEEGTTFYSAQEFLDFLKTRRKALYRKLEGRFVPDAASLTGPPAHSGRMAPFETRYKRLRVLGARGA